MPNWCDNNLIIKSSDKFDIGRVIGKLGKSLNFAENEFDFNEIVPVPEELKRFEEAHFTCIDVFPDILFDQSHLELNESYSSDDYREQLNIDNVTISGNFVCGDMFKKHINTEEYIRDKYTYTDQYNYRVEHWGTKWTGSEMDVHIASHLISITYQTPWAVPDRIIQTIIGWFPDNEIIFTGYEPGVRLLVRGTCVPNQQIQYIYGPEDQEDINEQQFDLLSEYEDVDHYKYNESKNMYEYNNP